MLLERVLTLPPFIQHSSWRWGRERQLSSSLLPFWQGLVGGGAISVTWKHSCWGGWSQRKLICASPGTLKSSSRSNWPSLCPATPPSPSRHSVMKASSCLISTWLKAGGLPGPPLLSLDQLPWDFLTRCWIIGYVEISIGKLLSERGTTTSLRWPGFAWLFSFWLTECTGVKMLLK